MTEQSVDLTDPRMLQRTAEHLSTRFAGTFFPELVERCVADCHAELSRTARLRTYLAPMAVHAAGDRLRALAAARAGNGPVSAGPGAEMPVHQVLFVDDHDAGPAAIAAALLTGLAGEAVVTRSAGICPAAAKDPYAEGVLVGHGVPAATAPPKPVTADLLRAADWVIGLGKPDLGPLRPGAAHQVWPVRTDPDASQWPGVVADLEARVTALQVEITALPARPG